MDAGIEGSSDLKCEVVQVAKAKGQGFDDLGEIVDPSQERRCDGMNAMTRDAVSVFLGMTREAVKGGDYNSPRSIFSRMIAS